ncbi:unnamed protein product [Lactuca saligna]|uniref:Uncharacterized protein n=1 Tax=Lactuca saligna TaxID=75948 RepID=A0AA35YPQ2_LACSI|nr:unnamed protein product [Lactuca saligna]
MEFKTHDYRAEEKVYSLTRISVSSHPLWSSPSSSLSHTQDDGSTEFFDPLRGLSTETLEPVENTAVVEKLPATQPTSHLSSKKEWTSFNKLLMQRFPIPKMISVCSIWPGFVSRIGTNGYHQVVCSGERKQDLPTCG